VDFQSTVTGGGKSTVHSKVLKYKSNLWRGWRGSNPRPLASEAGELKQNWGAGVGCRQQLDRQNLHGAYTSP
jgi:hypothetical protein